MRLLTHNTLMNASAEAKGRGFPLRITVKKIRVEEGEIEERHLQLVRHLLPSLEWQALVKAASEVGIPSLPPQLTEDLANDPDFLKALYHVLMNVHLVEGMLTCPVTGREFPVENEIPNMMLDEAESMPVRL